MIQITPDLVSDELRSMFHPGMPTGIRALAVLAGGNAGRILTDDPVRPHWGLVWEVDNGTLYRGGEYGDAILSEAVSLLRQDGIVVLGYRNGDPDADRFPPGLDAGAECLEFDRPTGSSDLSPYLLSLPEGYSVQRMDRALLERSPRLEEKINHDGSIENFLGKGVAICILHEGEIVCEALADMDILCTREIGIRTQEAYRRQGLATIACAHLIRLCEEAGSHMYWDCVKFNTGSVALAHKLGFQNERAYKLLAWFKPREDRY